MKKAIGLNPQLLALLKKKKKSPNLPGAPCQSSKQHGHGQKSPSTFMAWGSLPPLCLNSWSSLPLIPRLAQAHTPPPIWSMVASVCGLWPQFGHLETIQAVTMKSGSRMTLLQFLNLPGCGENCIRKFSCLSMRVGACGTGLLACL